jgi:hypothetical protein
VDNSCLPRSDGGSFLFCRGRGTGSQALPLRIFDQVQDTREKSSSCIRAADIDDRRVRQFLAKNIKDQAARVLVEVINRFIEDSLVAR